MNELISLTSAFLTATGLFFAALGATATYNEPLKVFLSLSALLMSVIWLTTALYLKNIPAAPKEVTLLLAGILPTLFVAGWLISFVVHSRRWLKGVAGPVGTHH